eukprot:752506-Hanusia_phi.AAC.8
MMCEAMVLLRSFTDDEAKYSSRLLTTSMYLRHDLKVSFRVSSVCSLMPPASHDLPLCIFIGCMLPSPNCTLPRSPIDVRMPPWKPGLREGAGRLPGEVLKEDMSARGA